MQQNISNWSCFCVWYQFKIIKLIWLTITKAQISRHYINVKLLGRTFSIISFKRVTNSLKMRCNKKPFNLVNKSLNNFISSAPCCVPHIYKQSNISKSCLKPNLKPSAQGFAISPQSTISHTMWPSSGLLRTNLDTSTTKIMVIL